MSARQREQITAIEKLAYLVEKIEQTAGKGDDDVRKSMTLYQRYISSSAASDAAELVREASYLVLIERLRVQGGRWTAIAGRLDKVIQTAAEKAEASKPRLRVAKPGEDIDDPRDPVTWQKLSRSKKGDREVAAATYGNAVTIFDMDPSWTGRIRYNTFLRRAEIDGQPITDDSLLAPMMWLDQTYRIPAAKTTIADALRYVALQDPYSPIVSYLVPLRWDGVERCRHLFTRYIVGDVSEARFWPLLEAFGVKWTISAVARARRPGCKVDTIPVLYGAKGVRKSTAFEVLASKAWFADSALDPAKKDAMEMIQGVWIYEWAEFDRALRKRGENTVRAFLSSKVDHFRWTHGREVDDYPRQGVPVATTNEPEFMTDDERRFWPVHVVSVDLDALRRDRDQIWAEANHRFNLGEPWHLSDDDERLLVTYGAGFEARDPWADLIARILEARPYSGHDESTILPSEFSISDVLVKMGLGPRDQTSDAANRVGRILRELGCVKSRVRSGNSRITLWRKPANEEEP